jgi:hypothetical protein
VTVQAALLRAAATESVPLETEELDLRAVGTGWATLGKGLSYS